MFLVGGNPHEALQLINEKCLILSPCLSFYSLQKTSKLFHCLLFGQRAWMIPRELCKYIVLRNVLFRQSKCRHLSCDPSLRTFPLRNHSFFSFMLQKWHQNYHTRGNYASLCSFCCWQGNREHKISLISSWVLFFEGIIPVFLLLACSPSLWTKAYWYNLLINKFPKVILI